MIEPDSMRKIDYWIGIPICFLLTVWYKLQRLFGLKNPRYNEKPKNVLYNYAYYPVIFEDENVLLKTKNLLAENNIFPRRYFFPSLNKLPYLKSASSCPVSENVAQRILCLPLYPQLTDDEVFFICSLVKTASGK